MDFSKAERKVLALINLDESTVIFVRQTTSKAITITNKHAVVAICLVLVVVVGVVVWACAWSDRTGTQKLLERRKPFQIEWASERVNEPKAVSSPCCDCCAKREHQQKRSSRPAKQSERPNETSLILSLFETFSLTLYASEFWVGSTHTDPTAFRRK